MGILCDWFGIGCTNSKPGSRRVVTADIVRYARPDQSGWLRTIDKDGNSHYLCEYTRVHLLKTERDRTYFEVQDSNDKGLILSLTSKNASTFLDKNAPENYGASLVVEYGKLDTNWHSDVRKMIIPQQLAIARFNGDSANITLDSGTKAPIPRGQYNIKIPDYPHSGDFTEGYRAHEPSLSYDQVWFPIEYGAMDRYVHVGHVSHGCVTTVSLDKWNALYKYLIRHRVPGGVLVGSLTVT